MRVYNIPMQYTCPMHPEIVQEKPGRCSKCGMQLVEKGKVASVVHGQGIEVTTWKSYLPLLIIIGVIFLTSAVVAWKQFVFGAGFGKSLLTYFMAGFFLVFSTFKLMDLKGFASGYFTYDLLAQKVFGYGYIYPFIELFFGLSMILMPPTIWLLWAEVAIMLFSGLGVAIKLARHEQFQCVCLGTFLKVPLTKVTLMEDFGMGFLALILLIVK
jgi:hypothetical protein